MRKLLVVALILLSSAYPVYAQQSLSFGVAQTSLNAVAGGAGTIGTYYASPSGGDAALVTWTTVYSAPPASVTMLLEASLDNVSWFTLDTSTAVAGELRNIVTSAKFFRCNISAVSGAVNKSCSFVLKRTNSATSGSTFAGNISAGGDITAGGEFYAGNGTVSLPSYSFTSDTDTGIFSTGTGSINFTLNGAQNAVINASGISVSGVNAGLRSNATGVKVIPSPTSEWIIFQNNANTIGSTFKVDALPTIASGFGTSPAIIAGSTPFAGAVNIGTGGAATSGIINFNGTAFPSGPFCVCGAELTNTTCRTTASVTQLTITSNVAWGASDIVKWICVSAK